MADRGITRHLSRLRALWPEALVVAGLTLAVVVPVWPGIYTIDSQAMLRAIRRDEISNWYAPVTQAAWRVLDDVGLPPATVLLIATVGLVIGALTCFRLGLGRGPAMLASAVLVLWPPVYGMAGWVGRDVWFAALIVGTLAAIGWAIRIPQRRWWLLGVATLLAWFAADARQNGFPVLAVVGGMLGWAWATRVRARRAWPRVVAGAAAVLAIGMASHTVTVAIVTTRTYAPDEILYWQDLVAMSLRQDEFVFPPELQRADLDEIRSMWVAGQVGAITFTEPTLVDYRPFRAGHVDRVRTAWLRAIRAHPIDYLTIRYEFALQTLGFRSGLRSAWFDRSDDLNVGVSRGLEQRFDRLADARAAYLDAFDRGRGTPGLLHLPWVYLVAGVIGAGLLIRVRGDNRVFGLAALALQLLLQGVLMVAAPVVEFRYEYPQVIIGPIMLVLGIGALREARRTGTGWPRPDGAPGPRPEPGPGDALNPDRAGTAPRACG